MSDKPMRDQTMLRVEEALSIVYTPEGIDIWWRSKNRNLGGQAPLALLADGDEGRGRIEAEAERVAGGAW
jgi:hypothetical protein